MPVSGKFVADFDSFHQAVDKAQADLRKLVSGAESTGPALDKMTSTGTTGLRGFHQGLSQADKTLAQFGVNIGSEIQAIKELSEVSGKSASQIGLIGTAALAAGAALAGWQVGRKIAELTGLDDVIGRATAKLLGFGDVAAEEAAAGADVLARASTTAGRAITDMTEAMRINAEEAATRFAPSFERFMQSVAGAQREYRGLSEATRDNMRTMIDAGATEKEVAATLKVSVGAVTALKDADKLRAEQQKINIQLTKEREAAEKKLSQAIDTMVREEFRQIAALQAAGKVFISDTLPAVLKAENELGVMMDDVTRRVRAQQAEWEAGQAAFNQEMQNGFVVIGRSADDATPKVAALRQETESLLKLMIPQGFSFEQAYSQAGFIVHGSLAGGDVHRGSNVNVTFNDAFIDTPAGAARVADRLGRSVLSTLSGQGRQIG